MSSAADQAVERAAALLAAGEGLAAQRAAGQALIEHPGHAGLWNVLASAYLVQGKRGDALSALDRAVAFDPANPEPLANLVQVRMGAGEWAAAEAAAARLTALTPKVPQAWVDLARMRFRLGRPLDAQAAVEAGLAANPAHPLLLRAAVELALTRLSAADASQAWLPGRSEGDELEIAYAALSAAQDGGVSLDMFGWQAASLFIHLGDHDRAERLGDFGALGRRWAASGGQQGLLIQLPRAGPTREDRLDLLEQHRVWGRRAEAEAAASPLAAPAVARGAKRRIGLLSSDMRDHPVAHYARPLIEHRDRERFELYVYSFFTGPVDVVQTGVAGQVDGYRHKPGAAAREMAEAIAADGIDILFELGGPTAFNRPETLAWRPAPVQASWLGYPHSMGLSAIDHILVDPYLAPPDRGLMPETPMVMPRTWITMDEAFFAAAPQPAAVGPSEANGFVTFGSANAVYKYSRATLDAWARVLAAVPDSRFLFVRPEAAAPSFRRNLARAFESRGVDPARLQFEAVRGRHLPFYDRMDVSLDTLPLTGGVTTCESLWMGVPVVTLAGQALFERLSFSILSNVGLADLAATDVDAYVAVACTLAADADRRRALKATLRDRVRNGPLGDGPAFARDFYALVEKTLA